MERNVCVFGVLYMVYIVCYFVVQRVINCIKNLAKKVIEYRNIPQQMPPNIEMRIERLVTTPLSTIEEEPIGYQEFRMS